jgi:hypothetical protein
MLIQGEEYGVDRTSAEQLALGLGWFSLALGAAEILAPRQLARLIGVPASERTTQTLRAYGVREIAAGVGILARPDASRWLWSRVGGDALDLATLGAAARDERSDPARLAFAAAAVAGVTALDILAARRLDHSEHDFPDIGFTLSDEQAITVKASLETVETSWVEWCASGLSKLKNNYAVRFEPAPGARGTEVHVSGGGSMGTLRDELRRFKQRLETGEIPLSDGPGLSRPARPREAGTRDRVAEVR